MRCVVAVLLSFLLALPVLAYHPAETLRSVQVTEFARPGDEVVVRVKIDNPRTSLLEDVRVYAYIPELALFSRTSNFDVDDDEAVTRTLVLELPKDTPPGVYLVLVGASSQPSGLRVRAFREILVI